MDQYEVTLGRFRQFYASYEGEGREVPAGAGAPPMHPDAGWQPQWGLDRVWLPLTADSVRRTLISAQDVADRDLDPQLPIRGVPWYLAMAFCIWDQARLPTEAEWAYAASEGGKRRYPWSEEDGVAPGQKRARYSAGDEPETGPSPVGSFHDGRGAYDHEDLAGNVSEWVIDVYENQLVPQCESDDLPGTNPNDCVRTRGDGGWQRVLRGGSYTHPLRRLLNADRSGREAESPSPHVGLRCVRDVQ